MGLRLARGHTAAQMKLFFETLAIFFATVMAAGVSVKSVAITGVGSIGLMAIPVARAAGATLVFAIDVNPTKLELAKQLGADATFVSTQPDLVDAIKRRTRGDGVDVLLEMSGSGAAIDLGLQLVRNGGTAALLGIPDHVAQIALLPKVRLIRLPERSGLVIGKLLAGPTE